jgi:hypothetical protein
MMVKQVEKRIEKRIEKRVGGRVWYRIGWTSTLLLLLSLAGCKKGKQGGQSEKQPSNVTAGARKTHKQGAVGNGTTRGGGHQTGKGAYGADGQKQQGGRGQGGGVGKGEGEGEGEGGGADSALGLGAGLGGDRPLPKLGLDKPVEGKNYVVRLKGPATAKPGSTARYRLELEPKGKYKINKLFPFALEFTQLPQGVTLPRKKLGKKDAKAFTPRKVVYAWTFETATAAKGNIVAIYKFSVCTKQFCEQPKIRLEWELSITEEAPDGASESRKAGSARKAGFARKAGAARNARAAGTAHAPRGKK